MRAVWLVIVLFVAVMALVPGVTAQSEPDQWWCGPTLVAERGTATAFASQVDSERQTATVAAVTATAVYGFWRQDFNLYRGCYASLMTCRAQTPCVPYKATLEPWVR